MTPADQERDRGRLYAQQQRASGTASALELPTYLFFTFSLAAVAITIVAATLIDAQAIVTAGIITAFGCLLIFVLFYSIMRHYDRKAANAARQQRDW